MDILPTLLELTQVNVKPKNPLDGTSFAPSLKGKNQQLNRTLFDNWGGRVRLLRDSLLLTHDGLYDLKNDREQKSNLMEQLPNVKKQLQNEFEAWEATLPADPEILPFNWAYPITLSRIRSQSSHIAASF